MYERGILKLGLHPRCPSTAAPTPSSKSGMNPKIKHASRCSCSTKEVCGETVRAQLGSRATAGLAETRHLCFSSLPPDGRMRVEFTPWLACGAVVSSAKHGIRPE